MLVKINRRDHVEIENIKKIVFKNNQVYVYLKNGYPKILKTNENISVLKNRLVNCGKTIHDFNLEVHDNA